MSRARLMPTVFLSLVLAPFLSKSNSSFYLHFQTTTPNYDNNFQVLRPLSPYPKQHHYILFNIACINTLSRLVSSPIVRDGSSWMCSLSWAEARPLSLIFFIFSDRFYYILVCVVVTGSYVAWRRHPDPRISHCSYDFLSCALSVLRSIIHQTTLP